MSDPGETRPPFEMPTPPPILPYAEFSLSPPGFPCGRQLLPGLEFADIPSISRIRGQMTIPLGDTIRDKTLRLFGLRSWHVGLAPQPLFQRIHNRRRMKALARRRRR